VLLPRRTEGEETHFQTIWIWENEEAIEAFSGSTDRAARLEPRDREYLLRSEPKAEHNELAVDGTNAFVRL
jgi:hypothetical protein